MSAESPLLPLTTFGLEIVHSSTEINEVPSTTSARESLAEAKFNGDIERLDAIVFAVDEVSRVLRISRQSESDDIETLEDIFTAEQIEAMSNRMHEYLGMSIDEHLAKLEQPPGYPEYIGKLAMYFYTSEDIVTSSFGAFERRHTDPTLKASGPLERNSRQYATYANEMILKQFDSFYQAGFVVELVGPTKKVEGSRVSWERGIAECQFLALDYIRDLLAGGSSSKQDIARPSMTVEDIEENISNLILNHKRIVGEVMLLNHILAEQIDANISDIRDFTREVVHRGRFGTPRFRREPDAARRAIQRVEMLLVHAAALNETRADQEEIPILDL